MARYRIERGARTRSPRLGKAALVILFLLLIVGARSIASYTIEYQWWKELNQTRTWFSMLTYGMAPLAAATLLAFAVLWIAHARGMKFAGAGMGEHRIYARVSALVLLGIGFLVAAGSIDTWTVVRYAGARGLAADPSAWRDAVFGRPLAFYLFDLPFYTLLRQYLLALTIVCVLLYWLTARAWQLRYRFPDLSEVREIDPSIFGSKAGWNLASCGAPW
jgi:uncharacterized membrane protein (UPF0182 family)